MQTAIREINPPEAADRHAAGATLIDVREQVEWDAGHIADALFIPQGVLLDQIEAAVPDRDTEIVLYCRSGARSGRMHRSPPAGRLHERREHGRRHP